MSHLHGTREKKQINIVVVVVIIINIITHTHTHTQSSPKGKIKLNADRTHKIKKVIQIKGERETDRERKKCPWKTEDEQRRNIFKNRKSLEIEKCAWERGRERDREIDR